MRYRYFLIILFSTNLLFPLKAQQVLVKNALTGNPISDVFIYSKDKKHSAYSDQKGTSSLKTFPVGKIHLQHPSYQEGIVDFTGEDLIVELIEKIISYDEVTVSANKWEQEDKDVSQQILSVDKKTIAFQNPQTSADLLNTTGQVFVQKSQLGGGSPKIRGFAANAVLLVVDGVRMNNAIFRGGNLQNVINIDPNALESSEMIFGPGSVIYGSDALGGVMDFHTITPKWSTDSLADITLNGMARYSSAANEGTGHIDLSLSRKRFTFFHSTTFTSLSDLRAGSNRTNGYEGEFERRFVVQRTNGEDALVTNDDINLQRDSGYNLFNTISKASFRIGQNADLRYGFYFSTTSDIPRYDNLTQTISNTDSLENAEWYYGPQQWMMHHLRFNYYQSTSLFDQAKITLAYQDFEERRNDRRFGSNELRLRTENVHMYSASLDFDKEIGKANIYYGVDFYHNDISSSGIRRNIETGETTITDSRYPDGGSSFTSTAIYGSLTHSLSQKIVLNAGLRFNSVQLKANTTNERALANNSNQIDLNNSALNGALGLVYNLHQGHKISYNISTGFRSPNVDDVGKVFDVGNRLTVPNPNLQSEHTLSNELSYQRKVRLTYFKVVGFYSRLFDAIVDGPFLLDGNSEAVVTGDTLSVSAKVNAGKAVVYGGSILFTTEFAQYWAFSKAISYTGGRDISNDEPLRHTTPLFGRAALTFQKNKVRSEFYIEYNSSRKLSDIPSSEKEDKPHLYTRTGTPGWLTLNWKTSYSLGEKIILNMGVENILDKHYRPYTSGISAPGRNFIITLRATL